MRTKRCRSLLLEAEVPKQEAEGARECTKRLGNQVSWLREVKTERLRLPDATIVAEALGRGRIECWQIPPQVPPRQPHAWAGLLLRY